MTWPTINIRVLSFSFHYNTMISLPIDCYQKKINMHGCKQKCNCMAETKPVHEVPIFSRQRKSYFEKHISCLVCTWCRAVHNFYTHTHTLLKHCEYNEKPWNKFPRSLIHLISHHSRPKKWLEEENDERSYHPHSLFVRNDLCVLERKSGGVKYTFNNDWIDRYAIQFFALQPPLSSPS